MAARHSISVETLRQLLRVDTETGRLYWLPRGVDLFTDGRKTAAHACARWNTVFAGREAFTSKHSTGCHHGTIFNRHYKRHRVVFALAHGYWPEQVDHRDGDRTNDRLSNLREATRAQNQQNKRGHGRTSQFKGVYFSRRDDRWRAAITSNGRMMRLGSFTTEADAAKAYDRAAAEANGEFARLNFP